MKNLNLLRPVEEEKLYPNLDNYLKLSAQKLSELGIPVTNGCRLDLKKFGLYSQNPEYSNTHNDERKETELRIKYEESKDPNENMGELLERLKTALLQKFLDDEFIICRTTFFDDYTNGVDNIIIDCKNGNIICAVDCVADINGEFYGKKERETIERSKNMGVSIKYGLTFNPQKKEIQLTPLANIPFFMIALPKELIITGSKNFPPPDSNEKPQIIRKLFIFCIASLKRQLGVLRDELEIKLRKSPWLAKKEGYPIFKQRLDLLEESLERIEKKHQLNFKELT